MNQPVTGPRSILVKAPAKDPVGVHEKDLALVTEDPNLRRRRSIESNPFVLSGQVSLGEALSIEGDPNLTGFLNERFVALGLVSAEQVVKASYPDDSFVDLDAIDQPPMEALGWIPENATGWWSMLVFGSDGDSLQVALDGLEDPCGFLDVQLSSERPIQVFRAYRPAFKRALERWTWPEPMAIELPPAGSRDQTSSNPLLTAWWEAGRCEPGPFLRAIKDSVEAGKVSDQTAALLCRLHDSLGFEFVRWSDRFGQVFIDDEDLGRETYWASLCARQVHDIDSYLTEKLLFATWLLDDPRHRRPKQAFETELRAVARLVALLRSIWAFRQEANTYPRPSYDHSYYQALASMIQGLCRRIPEPDAIDREAAMMILGWRPQ